MKEKIKRMLFRLCMLILLVGFVGLGAYYLGVHQQSDNSSTVTKVQFKNLGQLATQEADIRVVNVTDKSREVLGIKIPFTQTKYVYSYDVLVKAGYRFEEITYTISNKEIVVHMPKAEIFSSQLDLNSLKVYHESESIFQNIPLKEGNKALKQLEKTAVQEAEDQGIRQKAKVNGEKIITAFFAQEYDMKEYAIRFVYPE